MRASSGTDNKSFAIMLKALVRRREKILIVKQRMGKEKWDLPGGIVGEKNLQLPLDQALRKELEEKLGKSAKISVGKMFHCAKMKTEFASQHRGLAAMTFLARWNGGPFELSRAHDAYVWVDRDSHEKYNLPPHSSEAVQKFFEQEDF